MNVVQAFKKEIKNILLTRYAENINVLEYQYFIKYLNKADALKVAKIYFILNHFNFTNINLYKMDYYTTLI